MRAFVSIAPDPQSVTALASIQGKLRASPGGSQIHWTNPDQIHLTLCFLGNITPGQSHAVIQRLPVACDRFTPFTLRMAGLGCFPNDRRPRIIWIGLEGAVEQLLDLQASISHALSSLGLRQELKPFHPHLTLGRMRPGRHRLNLECLLVHNPAPLPPWQVKKVLLMRSELKPEGSRHSLIFTHDLAEAEPSPTHLDPAETPQCRTNSPSGLPGTATADSSHPSQ
jgi:2'-5' RNA ligase